jgi:amidohydrolase
MDLDQFLSNSLDALASLRHKLHQHPEVAGQEYLTADRIGHFFSNLKGFQVTSSIGGNGLWATYDSGREGTHTVFRAELDALPIADQSATPWASLNSGVGHQCGHDGHMTILCGLAEYLFKNPPTKGKVSFLFQPAEETGEGAAAMIADAKFANLRADRFIALHNIPGIPIGQITLRPHAICVASAGVEIKVKGRSSHAAEPEKGLNPWTVLKQLADFSLMMPSANVAFGQATKVTLAGMQLGDKRFGTSPGEGSLWLTLRSGDTNLLNSMISDLQQYSNALTLPLGYEIEYSVHDRFDTVYNEPGLSQQFATQADHLGFTVDIAQTPYSWSEDFGRFSSFAPTLFFGLGAGSSHPPLHAGIYDFPDELISAGIRALNIIIDLDHR